MAWYLISIKFVSVAMNWWFCWYEIAVKEIAVYFIFIYKKWLRTSYPFPHLLFMCWANFNWLCLLIFFLSKRLESYASWTFFLNLDYTCEKPHFSLLSYWFEIWVKLSIQYRIDCIKYMSKYQCSINGPVIE